MEPNVSLLPADAVPRIVNASIEKLRRSEAVPATHDTVRRFVEECRQAGPRGTPSAGALS